MHSPENCFTPFNESTDAYSLPERFTFPFYYKPHPLCVMAAKQLQEQLETQTQWNNNFGLAGDSSASIGKMFGVLVVKNKRGELGYLSAFSGKIADRNDHPGFVPPVFDMLAEDGFFRTEQGEITVINQRIKALSANPDIALLKDTLKAEIENAATQVEAQRQKVIEGRKSRKAQRAAAEAELCAADIEALNIKLGNESVSDKYALKDVKRDSEARVALARQQVHALTDEIDALKEQRKVLSAALQQKLFNQYRFLNIEGKEKNLTDIFAETPEQTPPAGAGECAAPKLLHYAFKHGLTPVAIAEFWWGTPPKSEIRQHKTFYAACKNKCKPILAHMLEGMDVDENPLLINPAEGQDIDIVYQDNDMLVIHKPADFLSVPGKNIEDSVFLRVKQRFPEATGPIIVHRLDMSTSGLMLIALTHRANHSLQKQFIDRTIQKRYVALIDGLLQEDEGMIELPLRGDPDDRPRQLVCHEHGKPAETKWQVIERTENKTKVYLYPKTGRTHQLRVHCAHTQGLHMPIIGDDLYGTKTDRLHLHAESIEFVHPINKTPMRFIREAEF